MVVSDIRSSFGMDKAFPVRRRSTRLMLILSSYVHQKPSVTKCLSPRLEKIRPNADSRSFVDIVRYCRAKDC